MSMGKTEKKIIMQIIHTHKQDTEKIQYANGQRRKEVKITRVLMISYLNNIFFQC